MTPVLFVKLLRDLRTIWPRIVLMILAMSVTLIVFSGVFYARGITGREMSRAYVTTNPASATILFERGLDADKMAVIGVEVRGRPRIIDSAARTQFTLQIQEAGGGWGPNPLQIFVASPADPMRIESLKVEQGSWPPRAGEILIDRSSFDLLDLQVEQTIVVQAPSGKPALLRISGVVYYPGLAPSFQEQKGHGFISAASLPILGEPVALDALKIQVADQPGLTIPSRNRDVIVAAARDVAGWLRQTHGFAVREIQVPTPYAHPHQRQADLLLMALVIFGVFGLLLSAVLVATMLNGIFVQQIPQIGIMKAIGAPSGRILQLYLLMTLVIAATATGAAFVPGIVISGTLAPAILTLLGVDAASVAAPWWMYVAVIAAGVGVPLLFSLASTIKASHTTVREALDYRGVDRSGDSTTRFVAWLSRVRGLNRMELIALRNVFRRRARFLLSVGLLASAGAVFVAGMSTMNSLHAVPEQAKQLHPWDVDVELADAKQASATMTTNLVEQVPHVTKVEGWTIVPTIIAQPGQVTVTQTYPDQGHGSIGLTVIPRGSSLMTPPSILEGRWLRPEEAGAIVISQSMRAEFLPGVRTGGTIQLSLGGRTTSWQVVGIAVSMGRGHGGGLFITENAFDAAIGVNHPNVLRIVTDSHDEDTRRGVAAATQRVLNDASIKVRSSASVSRSAAAGSGHMLPLILVFLGLSIGMGLVGCVGLASTMSTNVLERTREFGVMHVIGARPSTVRRIVVAEGVFMAVVSWIVAAIPTFLLTAAMSTGLGKQFLKAPLPFRLSISAVAIWVVVVVLGAALATLAPAYRASRLTVREALVYL